MSDEEQQGTLLSEKIPVGEHQLIEVADIIDPGGLRATAGFVKSVRDFGVQVPIAVVKKGKRFEVLDGLRRSDAARRTKATVVPAIVYPKGTTRTQLTVVLNQQRSSNPAAEAIAIESMINDGHSVEVIARDLNLKKRTVERRLAALNIIPALRKAFVEGKIKPSAAEAISKCTTEQQGALAKEFKSKGKLRLRDIAEHRRVDVQTALAHIGEATETPGVDWEQKSRAAIETLFASLKAEVVPKIEAIAELPDVAPGTMTSLEQARILANAALQAIRDHEPLPF